jgi:hypothetical protein
MYPLYTTGTGAQTGLKLARIYDSAKQKYNLMMSNLNKKAEYSLLFTNENPHEPDPRLCEMNLALFNQYIKERDQVADVTYRWYHAQSRKIIDGIRDVQTNWIASRNDRFVKAEKVFQVVQDALGLEQRVISINTTCQSVATTCDLKSKRGRTPLEDRKAPLGTKVYKALSSIRQ